MTPTIRIPLPEVKRRTGMGRSAIYEGMAKGWFPKCVKEGRRSLWVEAEVEAYVQASISRRDMGKDVGTHQAA